MLLHNSLDEFGSGPGDAGLMLYRGHLPAPGRVPGPPCTVALPWIDRFGAEPTSLPNSVPSLVDEAGGAQMMPAHAATIVALPQHSRARSRSAPAPLPGAKR